MCFFIQYFLYISWNDYVIFFNTDFISPHISRLWINLDWLWFVFFIYQIRFVSVLFKIFESMLLNGKGTILSFLVMFLILVPSFTYFSGRNGDYSLFFLYIILTCVFLVRKILTFDSASLTVIRIFRFFVAKLILSSVFLEVFSFKFWKLLA